MEHLLHGVFVEVGRFEAETPTDVTRFVPPEENNKCRFSNKGDRHNFQEGEREMLDEAADTMQKKPGELYAGNCLRKNINFC